MPQYNCSGAPVSVCSQRLHVLYGDGAFGFENTVPYTTSNILYFGEWLVSELAGTGAGSPHLHPSQRSADGRRLSTSISVAAGSHRFGVFGVNTAGTKCEGVVNATVK